MDFPPDISVDERRREAEEFVMQARERLAPSADQIVIDFLDHALSELRHRMATPGEEPGR